MAMRNERCSRQGHSEGGGPRQRARDSARGTVSGRAARDRAGEDYRANRKPREALKYGREFTCKYSQVKLTHD